MRSEFEQVYLTYYRTIRGKVSRILRTCPEAVEDVVHDGFLNAWKSRDAFRGECELKSWVMTCAIRRALMYLRSNKNRALDLSHASELKCESDVDSALMLAKVKTAIENMNHEWADAIYCVGFMGMSVEEAANALEISESAVKMRLYRGRQVLRQVRGER